MQLDLFSTPLVVSYGMGVDSTAMLVEFRRRGIRPDLILFADTGGEKDETYAYRATIDAYLAAHDYPTVTVVRYVPRDFKNWPPYYTLEANCLTNGTLPSLAFGFGSCSQKWKAAPQHRYIASWPPALACWARGDRVTKAIGYDAGPRDLRRHNRAQSASAQDARYSYWYPLIEWDWDRERCAQEVEREGLPVPPKSSCFYCPAMKTHEIDALPPDKLRRIVVMEARAKPRLGTVEGLWRKATRARPGSMTEYIREKGLLPAEEVDRLIEQVPLEIVRREQAHARGEAIASWDEFFRTICNPPSRSLGSRPQQDIAC